MTELCDKIIGLGGRLSGPLCDQPRSSAVHEPCSRHNKPDRYCGTPLCHEFWKLNLKRKDRSRR